MFIAIEGLDGVGKTTQVQRVAEALRSKGKQVLSVPALGGTPFGEKLREALKAPGYALGAWAGVMTVVASQMQLCEEVITPWLEEYPEGWVIADRWSASTYAYRYWMLLEDVKKIVDIIPLAPHLYIWLKAPPSFQWPRQEKPDRWDSNGIGFRASVWKSFHAQQQQHRSGWQEVLADQPPTIIT